MKKNILVLSILFAGIFNLRAEPVEYCSVQVKSLNDITNIATSIGSDLQLGVMPDFITMSLAQVISESFITPALDKPITAHIYVDSESSRFEELEPVGFVICIPHASPSEAIIEKLELDVVDAKNKVYKYYDGYVVFKSGYAIFGDQQYLCEKIAARDEYIFKSTLKADTIIFKYNESSLSTIAPTHEDIADLNNVFSDLPPAIARNIIKFINFSIEIVKAFNSGEIGLTYKNDLGLILEAKNNIDESSEIAKVIKSQSSYVSMAEAMMIKTETIVAGVIKENKLNKYFINRIISDFSLTQSEFNKLFAELKKQEEIIELFPELTEEDMDVKCYEAIKKCLNDFLVSYNAKIKNCFVIDLNKNNYPVFFEEITYRHVYDPSSYEKDSYKALIDAYNFAMGKIEYTPSTPFIKLINPMAVSFNFKAVVDEINPALEEISEMDEYVAQSNIKTIIPDSYIMETIVAGNKSYAYFAPEKFDLPQLKDKVFESQKNLFVRAAMQDMADNKPTSILFLSIGNLFNKVYDIAAPMFDIEEDLNDFGIAKQDKCDGIVYIGGITNDTGIYSRYVVGKETLLLMANIVRYVMNGENYTSSEGESIFDAIIEGAGDFIE